MDQINVTHSKRMTFMYARLLLKVTRPEPKGKTMQELWQRPQNWLLIVQGGFFDCSALKMTKCQPLKEISELFLPKND